MQPPQELLVELWSWVALLGGQGWGGDGGMCAALNMGWGCRIVSSCHGSRGRFSQSLLLQQVRFRPTMHGGWFVILRQRSGQPMGAVLSYLTVTRTLHSSSLSTPQNSPVTANAAGHNTHLTLMARRMLRKPGHHSACQLFATL